MKQVVRFSIIAVITVIMFSSCSKQVSQTSTTTSGTATQAAQGFYNLKVPTTFNWSTNNKVTFNFTGKTGEVYSAILKVTNADGHVIFQKLQSAGANYTGSIDVSFNSENVTVQFGDQIQSFNCKSGSVTMSLN